MKKHWKMLLILGAMLIALWGCQREFPQAPILISPEDGAFFTDEPPTFIWGSEDAADSYVLRICKDSFTEGVVLVEDTLEDTTYTMTDNIFQQLSTGSYEWAVAPLPVEDELLWCEVWTFNVDKSSPPPAPILIAPEDGAVFDLEPPDFIWHKDSEVTNYVIRIVKDAFFTGEKIVVDTLKDTTYTMTQEDFEIALNADYVWSVASLYLKGGLTWREFRSFTLDKPMPELDLDTTYFPLGLNYEWAYERHLWGADYSDPNNPDPPVWDYYDTVTITVADSVFGVNGWEFYLEGYLFRDVGYTVYIFGNRVLVFDEEKIPFNPEATGPVDPNQGVEIIYSSDTLNLSLKLSETWEPIGESWSERTTSRIKGIGVVAQLFESWSYGHGWEKESNVVDSLLYFYNGKDTVWRREGS
jgi:hypothetical protein